MAYLTYDEYKTFGGKLSDTEFAAAEFLAGKRIDRLTDCRVQHMAEVPEAVKRCAAALIDMDAAVGAYAQATDPAVTSFSTDGYSESYGNTPKASEAAGLMDKLATAYLYGEVDDDGVPLLYRGVRG